MEKIKIGDVCDILNGYAFKSENYVDSGIRIIRISNVQKGYIEDSTPAFYSFDTMGLSKFMLEEGDLLMSLTGNVGRVAILEKELLPAALNQRVACLRLKSNKITKSYLFHFLNSSFFEQQCIMASNGVAQKNMSTEWLKDYEIPLYTPNQQEEIVTVLNAAQSILSSRRQQLQKLDELVKARFVELFGELDKNPYGWKLSSLGALIASCEAGWSGTGTQRKKRDGEVAVLKVSAVTKGYFIPSECKVLDNQSNIKKYIYPQTGDLLFSRANTREMVGATVVITEDFPEHILPDKLWKIRFVEAANVWYMKYALSSKPIRSIFSSISTGTSGSMYNVSMEKFKSIEIPLPPLNLQNQFAAFVTQTDKSKAVIQKALAEAQLLFDSLMQKYFG